LDPFSWAPHTRGPAGRQGGQGGRVANGRQAQAARTHAELKALPVGATHKPGGEAGACGPGGKALHLSRLPE
jgi:hypothetical protein